MAVEGGGAYRQGLVNRITSRKSAKRKREQAFSTPAPKQTSRRTSYGPPSPTDIAYTKGFNYLGDFIKDVQLGGLPNIPTNISEGDYGTAGMTLALGSLGAGKGRAAREGVSLLDQISTPVLRRAMEAAKAEGQYVGGDIFESGVAQGVRYPMSGINRAAEGAEDALFEFIQDLERIGAKPQTVNRILRGFSQYADDPFEAMVELGGDVGRAIDKPTDFKDALVQRIMRRLAQGAESRFLGG